MELSHYTEELQRQLISAAAAGTEETQATAERLAQTLDAATRLVIVEALSEATGEISRDLSPGSVDLRVRGRDVDFVVTVAEPDPSTREDERASAPSAPVSNAAEPLDDDATSRTTLRLPDTLKQRAEAAAAAEGLSLNAWLVRAIQGAVTPAPQSRRGMAAARYTGWVR
ncbi:toxin-antitoxin system HicB family antitoxin [Demequina globuliformis]|uniref:toxin-antitoxin system HicB family antitoxin n=1 Tax=Demequina globuliformis TaxID=676202 RepID=UPI0007854F6F|nr:toxin-antitoxin system HicB family antitoxin [Demequina globuliformis]